MSRDYFAVCSGEANYIASRIRSYGSDAAAIQDFVIIYGKYLASVNRINLNSGVAQEIWNKNKATRIAGVLEDNPIEKGEGILSFLLYPCSISVDALGGNISLSTDPKRNDKTFTYFFYNDPPKGIAELVNPDLCECIRQRGDEFFLNETLIFRITDKHNGKIQWETSIIALASGKAIKECYEREAEQVSKNLGEFLYYRCGLIPQREQNKNIQTNISRNNIFVRNAFACDDQKAVDMFSEAYGSRLSCVKKIYEKGYETIWKTGG